MVSLVIIFFLVLLLPLTLKFVERNLELFLFVMGIVAAVVGGVMSSTLFVKATIDPVKITVAVLLAGLLFKWFHTPLNKMINELSRILSFRLFVALSVTILGLISSMITAIIASLVLVLIVSAMKLERRDQIRFVVLACYSIGLGAALTPIGEPLSTITISKLNGDFLYLTRLLGIEVVTALIILGLLSAFLVNPSTRRKDVKSKVSQSEGYDEIINRSLKVYFFVMGLTFLGAGFEPMIKSIFLDLHPALLYWINMISAILDNATLSAAEISPVMDETTIRSILLGLLISGGMLIPGNIPNIIAAGKLQITSKEWASFGVPVGLISMVIYYVWLFVL